MQCCPRGSRQLCIRNNPVQCCLNTLGTTLHRSQPYAILSERPQTTLHKKILCNFRLQTIFHNKILCNFALMLWTTLHRSKPYAMLCERLQTKLHPKNPVQCCLKYSFTLDNIAQGTPLCNVVPEAPDNIAEE